METGGLLARAGWAHTRAGQRDQAIRDYTDALRLATEVGMHHLRCRALAGP